MNQLEKLIQQQAALECELHILKSEISNLQLIKDELQGKQYKVNILKTLLKDYKNSQIYLCKSNQASALREAETLLEYTWYNIVRDKHYDEDYGERDDYDVTVFSPVIDECIPSELLSDVLKRYVEILEFEIKQLEDKLGDE